MRYKYSFLCYYFIMKKIQDSQLARKLYNSHAESYFSNQNKYPVHRQMLKVVNTLIGDPKNKKILFAGCGDAEEARYSINKDAFVTGIDISEKCIEIANKHFSGQNFKVMDFEKTIFKKNQFDFVISIMSVMYKSDLLSVLNEFKRVIKKNGKIIVVVPHPIRKMIKYNNMNYFIKGKKIEVWQGNKRFNYYRTFEDYINMIVDAGLIVNRVIEPKPPLESTHPHYLIFIIKISS